MKKALITLMDDDFIVGAKCFLKSLLKYNPWFDLPFIVLDAGLSDYGRSDLLSQYSKIEIRPVEVKNYENIKLNKTSDRLKKTFWTLDVFIQTDFDRLVFIDMDTVVLDDISELFDCTDDIAGAKAYDAKRDDLRRTINTGVFVVNKRFINNKTYKELLQRARNGFSMPDQAVINHYFDKNMAYINKGFNVEKRMISTRKYRHVLDKIKIMHFVAHKPWQDDREPGFEKFEQIWWEHYDN